MSKSEKLESSTVSNTAPINIPRTEASYPYTYQMLAKEGTVTEEFRKFFASNGIKYSVMLYGDGAHANRVDAKINLWGGRAADHSDVKKCFVIQATGGGVLGYVNIGVSTLKNAYEFGALFRDDVPADTQGQVENTILTQYMLHNKDKLAVPIIIGTQSTLEYVRQKFGSEVSKKAESESSSSAVTTSSSSVASTDAAGLEKLINIQTTKTAGLLEAGFTKLTLPPTNKFDKDLYTAIENDKRFKVGDNKIYEVEKDELREVDVVYYNYTDQVPVEVEGLGFVPYTSE